MSLKDCETLFVLIIVEFTAFIMYHSVHTIRNSGLRSVFLSVSYLISVTILVLYEKVRPCESQLQWFTTGALELINLFPNKLRIVNPPY